MRGRSHDSNGVDSGPDGFTEHSHTLNPRLKGRDIREAFKGDEYQILLVANKFQTGFDQPLLHTMYVDKKLGGVNAEKMLALTQELIADRHVDNLAVLRPTFMAGPPRIFEKVHNRVIASVEAEGGVKAMLFAKAA